MATKAPLIPLTAVKEGPGEQFLLEFGEPIKVPEGLSKDASLKRIYADYADRLEPWIRAYPGQWRGWNYLSETGSP